MKSYEEYILDEQEMLVHESHKELATDGIYDNGLSSDEINVNRIQANVVEAIFNTAGYLTQKDDIELSTCHFFSFSIIKSQIGDKQILIESPRLSREKLLTLPIFELTKVITDLFLDYENWDQTLKQSFIINFN